MLECHLCNYLKKIANVGENTAKCDFTGHVFFGEKCYDTDEYPCRNRSYAEYLVNRESGRQTSRVADEDWRYPYLKQHPVIDRDRWRRQAV